eukprot:TRINITY_DN40516_c0_g1_i1.p1 TRINITY_DN40516_c0_g1~~TRINITY_DN40516_c0_g1_i1.p1  ORF type:complete len:454 (-),score=105.71 TRINITY_DN40516_c0_g1_i1:37-1398(-)
MWEERAMETPCQGETSPRSNPSWGAMLDIAFEKRLRRIEDCLDKGFRRLQDAYAEQFHAHRQEFRERLERLALPEAPDVRQREPSASALSAEVGDLIAAKVADRIVEHLGSCHEVLKAADSAEVRLAELEGSMHTQTAMLSDLTHVSRSALEQAMHCEEVTLTWFREMREMLRFSLQGDIPADSSWQPLPPQGGQLQAQPFQSGHSLQRRPPQRQTDRIHQLPAAELSQRLEQMIPQQQAQDLHMPHGSQEELHQCDTRGQALLVRATGEVHFPHAHGQMQFQQQRQNAEQQLGLIAEHQQCEEIRSAEIRARPGTPGSAGRNRRSRQHRGECEGRRDDCGSSTGQSDNYYPAVAHADQDSSADDVADDLPAGCRALKGKAQPPPRAQRPVSAHGNMFGGRGGRPLQASRLRQALTSGAERQVRPRSAFATSRMLEEEVRRQAVKVGMHAIHG